MISRKPLDLPPAVAHAFVEDMRAFFAEENPVKRDAIALRQLMLLKEHQGPRDRQLRLEEIREQLKTVQKAEASACSRGRLPRFSASRCIDQL